MAAREDDAGLEPFAVLCKILLIVFQGARSLDEEKWTSEEFNDLWERI